MSLLNMLILLITSSKNITTIVLCKSSLCSLVWSLHRIASDYIHCSDKRLMQSTNATISNLFLLKMNKSKVIPKTNLLKRVWLMKMNIKKSNPTQRSLMEITNTTLLFKRLIRQKLTTLLLNNLLLLLPLLKINRVLILITAIILTKVFILSTQLVKLVVFLFLERLIYLLLRISSLKNLLKNLVKSWSQLKTKKK